MVIGVVVGGLRAVAVFSSLALCSVAVGQSPFETLQAAAQQYRERSTQSADVSFRAEISSPPVSGDEQAEIIQHQADAIQTQIEAYADQPDVRRMFENALANNIEVMTEQIKANAEKKVVGSFQMFGSGFGADELFEVTIECGSAEPFRLFLLQRRLDEKSVRSVSFDVSSRLVMVGAENASVGVSNPVMLGRLPTDFLNLLESGTILQCSLDEDYPMDAENEVCIKFQGRISTSDPVTSHSSSTDTGLFGRVVIDPSRGYICPLFEIGFHPNSTTTRIKCTDFFEVANKGVWFPQSCVTELRTPNGPETTRYFFEPDNVRLNDPLSEKLFSIHVPAGTRVQYQLGRSEQRTTVCDIEVNIDDLDDLLSHPCFSAVGISNASTTDAGNGVGWIFVIANVVLLIGVIIYLWMRSRTSQ